jgi:PBP1b-binding outer membrane lipoprotein LpoB
MKNLWLLIFLLVAGCSDNSDNTTDNAKQPTNDVASANESANNQVKTLLASRYSAISNLEKNLPRHGAGSTVFSIDVQKALTSATPILFTVHLDDVFLGETNGITYAVFTHSYKPDKSVADTDDADFVLKMKIQLTDEQTQKLLSAPKDVISDEYALVAKISNVESSADYPFDDDNWPTLLVKGTCVDFALLK